MADARPPTALSRRGFLLGSVGAAATTAALFLLSRGMEAGRTVRRLALPAPASPAKALPAGLEAQVHGISPLQTPSDRFYRVDTNLAVPDVDPATWSLSIDGMVEHPYSLTLEELLAMPLVERDITMTCVSNEVGGPYVGSARWLGVRLTDLLGLAGTRAESDQLLSTAVDGFTISTPLSVATDGRDAMVAVGMNGAALPSVHGFPARLLVPGLYGFVGATKWLTRLTLTTYAAEQAYWTKRQWATDAPVKTGSRIDTPVPLATIPPGRTPIGGVAWAQHRGVSRVEVRIDDGPWQPARLGPDVGIDYWRQWWLPWNATSGMHRLAVRATDGHGVTQPARRATPFPAGASGIPDIVVTVA
jgi:DMSO/TMAO reductase YedYZ molybdopterin-dependent catalytic subunit